MNLSDKAGKIVMWCDRIMFGAFCGFIYFVPISIVLIEYAFGFAFLPYVFKRIILVREQMRHGKKWRHVLLPVSSPLNLPIALFLFVSFFSIFISVNPSLSIKAFFFKLLEAVFFYFILIECMTSGRRMKIFIFVFFLSALLTMTNGFVQMFSGEGFIFGHLFDSGRISSTFRHANDYGSYLLIVCLLALGLTLQLGLSCRLVWKSRQPGRWLKVSLFLTAFAVFMLAMGSLGLTYSRGAWLGFFVGLFFLGVKDVRLVFLSILIGVTFYVAFVPGLLKERKVSLVYDDVHIREQQDVASEPQKTEEAQGLPVTEPVHPFNIFNYEIVSKGGMGGSGRSGYWQEALSIIRKFPLFGTGLNTYSVVGPSYKVNWGGYPHNCYLHMAAEIGLVGLFSFLWILFVLVRSSIISIRRISEKDPLIRGVLIGGLMGTIGFLSHSFVDTNMYSVQLGNLIWVMFGVVIAAQKIEMQEG